MKILALTLCGLCLAGHLALAQQPPVPTGGPAPRPLPRSSSDPSPTPEPFSAENYLLTLTVTEKEQTVSRMSLVVAAANFNTSFPDSALNVTAFQGTLALEENGTIILRYTLGGTVAVPTNVGGGNTSFQYKSVSTQSTVRLKLGEPVPIQKIDARVCTLVLTRLADAPAQGK